MKRRRALAGIFTLALSSFALRGAGLLFRLALTDRLGAEGMGIYQLISTVDLFCSLLTCAGIPLTVSRLCAERRSQARSVVQQACFYGAAMGLLPAMALFLFSDSLALHLLGDIRTAAALRWIRRHSRCWVFPLLCAVFFSRVARCSFQHSPRPLIRPCALGWVCFSWDDVKAT